jgi:hypothetical protein
MMMMGVMPPVGCGDSATDHFGGPLDGGIGGLADPLAARFDAVDVELDNALRQMATKAGVSRLRADLSESMSPMQRSVVASPLRIVAAVVGLVGFTRAALIAVRCGSPPGGDREPFRAVRRIESGELCSHEEAVGCLVHAQS